MKDREDGRQAPSESRIKLPHHGRPGVGAEEKSEKRPTVGQSHVRPRQKGAISPPPLKRQRTAYDDFSAETYDPRSTSRQAHPPTGPSALRHSFSGHTEITSTVQSKQKPEITSVSKSFPVPSAPHRHDNRNTHSTSGRRHVSHPKQPSKTASLHKPTCRICDKSSATSYNPIVLCSGCSRSYHDSCRKPPLAPGIDPQRWRCSLCLSDSGTRTNASLSSALALASHSVVRDIFKSRYAQPAPGVTPSDHLPKTNSDTHVKPEPARLTTSATTSVKLIKPKKASASSQPPEPMPLERTEVPNTPSQRSSQFENPIPKKSSGRLRDAHISQQYQHVQDDDDALALEASTHVQNHTPSTTLCSTCQKQAVLAKAEEKGVQCSGCRTRTRVAETERLEIPETPNVDSNHNAPPLPTSSASSIAHCSAPRLDDHEPVMVSSTQDLPMSEAKPGSAMAKASPLSWFDPKRAKILPKIRKVRDDELSCISTADIQATDAATTSHENFLGQSTSTEVDSIADISEQKTALKAKQVLQENPICDNAAVAQVDMQRENCIQPAASSNYGESLRASEPHDIHSVSPSKSGMLGESEPPKPATAVPGPIERSTDILPKSFSAERTTDRVVPTPSAEEQGPTILKSNGTAEGVRSPPDLNVSLGPNLASTSSPEPNKHLSNRDLARIALVGAKGTGMTALQVIDWLASKFSYLQKGHGAWEKSLKSVLSVLPEIHGVKAPHESRVLYSFASAALRAKYEKQYQSYLPPVSVPGPQGGGRKARKSVRQRHGADTVRQYEDVQIGPSTQIKSSVIKAIKSAPSRRTVTTHASLPPPNTASVTSEDDTMFNPFERTTARRPKIALFDDVETKRETSFRSVYPRTTAPSIETMTSEEKAEKIAEIKARPSRKQFFNSVYRLAHVRRYGRQDIHDESDGAWKPDSTKERPVLEHDPAMNDCDENRSLLEVFNLPSNAIPMNDGNELAFRDGTLVNGRLPRPRQIYRVGEVFGGELTIS